MSVGDSFDQFEKLLRENMSGSVMDLGLKTDDPLLSLVETMRNTKKMGRMTGAAGSFNAAGSVGYEARWECLLQRGGRMSGARFGETNVTKMGPGSSLIMGMDAASQHLDPVDTPVRSYIELISTLRKARGSVVMNRDQLEADLIADPIENVAYGYLEDATFQTRELIGSLSWGAGDGLMAVINQTYDTDPINESTIVWLSVDGGSPYRFVRGQRYVLVSVTDSSVKFDNPITGTGATAHTPSYMRCVGINPRTLKVGFQSEPGEGNIVWTDNDRIVYQGMWDFTTAAGGAVGAAGENTPSLAPNGVENLLITTGQFPDTTAITSVADYPELQAFITGTDGDETLPTPERIDNLLNNMIYPGSPDATPPPILIAEPALWTLYSQVERRAFAMTPVTQTYTSGGGVSGPVYTSGGRSFQILNSSKCKQGTIYGIDPSTFQRFFPNDLTLRWVMEQGGMSGMGSIFRPICNGRILTDLSAAEYEMWWQLAQLKPNRNLIYRGLATSRTYSV